jgi:hypothetical protein
MDDYCYLCCNCGFITAHEKWSFVKWDDEGEALVPVEPGEMDPYCICPVCDHMHVDDDSNPGFMDGTYRECVDARPEQATIFQDHWNDVALEVFSNGYR